MINPARLLPVFLALALAIMVSAPAGAYTFWKGSHSDSQTELWINPNCSDSSAGSPAEQIRSILGGTVDGGADAWGEQASSGWRGFCFAGITTVDVVDTEDGMNIVVWHSSGGNGAIALTYCNGQTVDDGFDIVLFDQDRNWSHDSSSGGTDIKGVMTHECGHALGLGHSGTYESTMWTYLKAGGVANRVLSSDDEMGVRALYGLGAHGAEVCLFEPVSPVNDNCESALDLFPGDLVESDTIFAADDYNPGAGNCTPAALPGPDTVYRVSLTQGEELNVQVSPLTIGYDVALHLFAGCSGAPGDCLAGIDQLGGNGIEVLSFTAEEEGDYFLTIDSPVAGGYGSCGIFVLSVDVNVGSPSTVLASLNCSTTSGSLPCGVDLGIEITNLTDVTRRVEASLDLDAADGQVFSSVRHGLIDMGPDAVFSRNLVISFPAVGTLDGTNTFRLVVDDITTGDPTPMAGDRSESSCSVVTSLD